MEHTLWNTFDAVRPRLNAQYHPMALAADTGVAQEELLPLAEARVIAEWSNPGSPRADSSSSSKFSTPKL